MGNVRAMYEFMPNALTKMGLVVKVIVNTIISFFVENTFEIAG